MYLSIYTFILPFDPCILSLSNFGFTAHSFNLAFTLSQLCLPLITLTASKCIRLLRGALSWSSRLKERKEERQGERQRGKKKERWAERKLGRKKGRGWWYKLWSCCVPDEFLPEHQTNLSSNFMSLLSRPAGNGSLSWWYMWMSCGAIDWAVLSQAKCHFSL